VTITCSGCRAGWTALNAAHCSGCHRTFAGPGLFDIHRTAEGRCLDPELVVGRDGQRRLFFRTGMWRGPELTDEQRAKLARTWGGEAGDPIPA